ncbi:MAG: translation initiation factor SUI1 [Arcobacter sp.]|nr:MAG: translation initiation factor SUI1 [Arcobacter sp.]
MFSMGASLDGEKYDTKKEDKKKQPNKSILPKNQHQLVFTYEKRKGKPVTLVGRFYIKEEEKKAVLKLLKKKLACGGAIKDEWIELQGDVKDKIKEVLKKEDWKFKN